MKILVYYSVSYRCKCKTLHTQCKLTSWNIIKDSQEQALMMHLLELY